MNKLVLIFVFVITTISCQVQKADLSLQWKEFNFSEAGMKASFPCEPKKFFKSFQDEPRPIHVYSFSCEVEYMKFLISSKNYMEDFNEKTFDQTFEATENNLKTMFGEIESLSEKKEFLTNRFTSRYYDLKLKSGGKINQLMVVSKVRFYDAMFVVMPESEKRSKNSRTDYEAISKNFIGSFQVIE